MTAKTSSARIAVSGLIAQHPQLGGMTWHYLQYVIGLKRLGHDVCYIEDSGEWPYNLHGGDSGTDFSALDCGSNVEFLRNVMSSFGLDDQWAYHCPITDRWHGRNVRSEPFDLLINVSGTLARPADYRNIGTLAYVDTDPVFTQIKLARGDQPSRTMVDLHDLHFSFGETLGPPLPPTGHTWLPTHQPVVLSEWAPSPRYRDVYSTVMNWASYSSETYQGRRYGQKDIEFVHFLDIPFSVWPAQLEIAVRGTRKGELPGFDRSRGPEDLPALLKQRGWLVVDAIDACGDFSAYRDYLRSSKAEWSVAKNGYVSGRAGWFSDRSACYLAAGRPVIAQDTGFAKLLPVGAGLLSFTTAEEAVQAIRDVEANYAKHARAAREIAEAYFDSDKVLTRLVEAALETSPAEVRA